MNVIAEIRTQDDLVEALRAAKDFRGLSNRWCDEIGDLTTGQTDKCLGPSRTKGLSRFLFGMYHRQFAVKLLMVVDTDMERIMQPKWEGRDQSNVRVESGRVSKQLIARARPYVIEDVTAALQPALHNLGLRLVPLIEEPAPCQCDEPIALPPLVFDQRPETKRHAEGKYA